MFSFKSVKGLAITSFVASMSLSSLSAREFADIYTECGLGAIIAPRNAAVAAVTNVTWDLGTTAITSNISSPDSCQGGKAKTAAFIFQSYDHLEKEIAMGNGDYLDTMMMLSGTEQKNQAKLNQDLRQDFGKFVASQEFSSLSKNEKAETLYNLLYKNIQA